MIRRQSKPGAMRPCERLIGLILRSMSALLVTIPLLAGCSASRKAGSAIPSSAQPTPSSYPSSLAQIQARGVLIVGTAITEPFEYYDPDSGELVGFDVDTAEYIADKLGVETEWIEMPFANLIPALQERKVDITIAAMYINPEREQMVDFAEAYIRTGLVMVIQPHMQRRVRAVDDLAGLRVGVKIGATGAKLAQDLISEGIALQSVEYKDTLASLLDLEVGRLDVVFNDYLNTLVYIKNTDSNLYIVSDQNSAVHFLSQAGLGIAVHQGDDELLAEINRILIEMQENGTFDRLYKTWLAPTTSD